MNCLEKEYEYALRYDYCMSADELPFTEHCICVLEGLLNRFAPEQYQTFKKLLIARFREDISEIDAKKLYNILYESYADEPEPDFSEKPNNGLPF